MGTTKLELDKKAYFNHADTDASVETAYFLEVIRRRLIEYCRTARAEFQILETYTHFLTSIGKMERIGFLSEGTCDAIDYVIHRLHGMTRAKICNGSDEDIFDELRDRINQEMREDRSEGLERLGYSEKVLQKIADLEESFRYFFEESQWEKEEK